LRLEKLAESHPADDQSARKRDQKLSELNTISQELNTASINLARAESEAQYSAVARVLDGLSEKKKQLEGELAGIQRKAETAKPSGEVVGQVLRFVDRLAELADQPEDFATAKEIIELANLRLFLRFKRQKLKKHTVNKIVGGVVTFGEAEAPVELYQGSTSPEQLKENSRSRSGQTQESQRNTLSSGEEGKSSRNVNRDDRI
jgi:hypothetical protein